MLHYKDILDLSVKKNSNKMKGAFFKLTIFVNCLL